MRAITWSTLVLASLAGSLAWADDAVPPSNSIVPETLCKQAKLKEAEFFPRTREAALKVRRVLCVEGGSYETVLNALIAFIQQQRDEKWFDRFGGFENNAEPLATVFNSVSKNDTQVPTLAITATDDLDAGGSTFRVKSRAQCEDVAKNGTPCGKVLDEFVEYYTYAHTTFASKEAMEFAKAARGLSKDWDRYLNDARSQTPLELLINSTLYKRSETLQFSAPPDVQWIALHPSLVVENVQAALDGDNTKEALMVELVGANWWRQEKWYIPTGGSLVAVYTDRPGVQDMGYGVALHFRSVYSIGYANHDGSDGVFISFDLLKLVQNKQKTIEKFVP